MHASAIALQACLDCMRSRTVAFVKVCKIQKLFQTDFEVTVKESVNAM